MWVRVSVALAAMLAGMAAAAQGLQCDTQNQCLGNGMCMPDGTCQGTPLTGQSCDIVSDILCQVNGLCDDNGDCLGDPAPAGTSCASGCGTCQPIVLGVPLLECQPIAAQVGKPCDLNLGSCIPGVCTQSGLAPLLIASCLPAPKQCPDIDNNPCTTDACDPATGQCAHSDQPPCIPQCETCNPATPGGCMPANIGAACDDSSSECPVVSSCQILAGRGFCLAGTPSSTLPTATPTRTTVPASATPTATLPAATATPTATLQLATATPTSLATATATMTPGGCVGDCNHNGPVKGDDLLVLMEIALGAAPTSVCQSLDNASQNVNVIEVLLAVNSAANNCGL